ncbi:Glutaredoxin/Glutathione S-transferase, N-terminal domain containing protein [Novymonas esmeraldas]|uniref:Glutaredoxin/Glutathione S-transferase, N-terminal domain containing protein n=1 Tax=Novymonas esmeraldas TaxID=1808958 RepID=A0AAW0EML7_9TRYP
MRFLAKVATATAVTIGGGAAAVVYCQRSSSAAASGAPKELSAKEFNSLQNAALLQDALTPSHLPWTYHALKDRYTNLSTTGSAAASATAAAEGRVYTHTPADIQLTFYRLLGCPYCAKVEAVLRYHDVPYEEVWIDPLSGQGLPDRRYQLAPQLRFTPLVEPPGGPAAEASDSRSVYLVDSGEIAAQLSTPLQYTADVANPRISATRDWITNHFQGASFAIANNSFRDAYATYTYVTPSSYQNVLYHVVGSAALSVLSRYKIQPRLVAKMECSEGGAPETSPATAATSASTGLWMLSETARQSLAATIRAGVADDWLLAELQTFLQRRPDGNVFHGGNRPDLADVEMYGVTRVVDEHPRLGAVVRNGAFGEWQTAMQEKLRAHTGAVYA